jgi:hypothetical protein
MNTKDQVHSSEGVQSEKRLEFEKFLADLSARFVVLPPIKSMMKSGMP